MNHIVRKESEFMGILGRYCQEAIEGVARTEPEAGKKMRLLGKLLTSPEIKVLERVENSKHKFLNNAEIRIGISTVVFQPLRLPYRNPDFNRSRLIFKIGQRGSSRFGIQTALFYPPQWGNRESGEFRLDPLLVFDLTDDPVSAETNIYFWYMMESIIDKSQRLPGPKIAVEYFLALYNQLLSFKK